MMQARQGNGAKVGFTEAACVGVGGIETPPPRMKGHLPCSTLFPCPGLPYAQ